MAAAGDWSGAPADLLWKILQRLHLADHIRFGAVCVPWRTALSEKRHPPAPHIPWLVIPGKETSPSFRFLIISENREYRMYLPGIGCHRCITSSDGWLLLMDKFSVFHMFHAISQSYFRLPSISTLRDCSLYREATISISSSSYQVAATTHNGTLAFCRKGDESWTAVETRIGNFEDFLFHKEKLFAVNWSGAVVDCDLSDLSITMYPPPNAQQLPINFVTKYLVELSGDLLEVWRQKLSDKLFSVRVFKLDQEKDDDWVELSSLGEHALLIGRCNQPVSVSSQDFPLLKRNCVYFTDNICEEKPHCKEIQGWNLHDGTMVSYIMPSFTSTQ